MNDRRHRFWPPYRIPLVSLIVIWIVVLHPSQVVADAGDELARIEYYYNLEDFDKALYEINGLLIGKDLTEEERNQVLSWKGRCLVRKGAENRSSAIECFLEILQSNEDWPFLTKDFKEQAVFQDAQMQHARTKGETQARTPPGPLPSLSPTYPIIASSLFAASAVTYLGFAKQADDRWNEYENDPSRPNDLYDSYKSSADARNIAGYVAIGTGVLSGVLLIKYFLDKKNFKEPAVSLGPFEIAPVSQGALVSLRF